MTCSISGLPDVEFYISILDLASPSELIRLPLKEGLSLAVPVSTGNPLVVLESRHTPVQVAKVQRFMAINSGLLPKLSTLRTS